MSRRYSRRHGVAASRPPRRSAPRTDARRASKATPGPSEAADAQTATPEAEIPEAAARTGTWRPPEAAGRVAEAAPGPVIERELAPGPVVGREVSPVAGTGFDPAADLAQIGCTAAQLRRFIKSRPYVPMHELRRRFELNGSADDVSPIETPDGMVYLGLPARESTLVEGLVRQGDVGLELCRDPRVPMVVGVYAMRPITRQ